MKINSMNQIFNEILLRFISQLKWVETALRNVYVIEIILNARQMPYMGIVVAMDIFFSNKLQLCRRSHVDL